MFGNWKNEGSGPNEKINSGAANWKPENVVVDMPEAGQAAVTVARPAINRTSPEYYAALVANAALGNGFVSRLNREIRIKRGLSYGAGSSFEARRQPGLFSATVQTKNESAAEVAQLVKAELTRMVTDPVKGAELQARKAVLTGGYARKLETNEGFIDQISELSAYDLPLDTLDKYIPSIDAVTTEAVTDYPISSVAPPQHSCSGAGSAARTTDRSSTVCSGRRKSWSSGTRSSGPLEDLPLLRARMRSREDSWQRYRAEYLQANAPFRRYVLRELEQRGPLLSREIEDHRPSGRAAHRWWGERKMGLMLGVLNATGEVAVVGRRGNQRLWDLAERWYPETERIPWAEAKRRSGTSASDRSASSSARAARCPPGCGRRPGAGRARHVPLALRPAGPRP